MTIQFPDRSNHDGLLPVAGLTALIAKATEGTGFVDSAYAHNRDGAAAAGIPFCAYHFLHDHDIDAQAAHAFAVVGPAVPLMLDWEKTDSGEMPNYTQGSQFIQTYRRNGGLLHLTYLPRWYWQLIGSPDLRPLAAADVSLISSHYTTYSDTGPGWLPYGGVAPAIWQYQGNPDWNAFKGTAEQLAVLFGTGQWEDDMALSDADAQALIYRVEALINNRTAVAGGPTVGEQNKLAAKLTEIDGEVEALATGGIDEDALAAKVAAALAADPAFRALLVTTAKEGANLAEDS